MSRNLGNPGLYDEGMIDHRNARPLTIALARGLRHCSATTTPTERRLRPGVQIEPVVRGAR
jgi:hypothetical protein